MNNSIMSNSIMSNSIMKKSINVAMMGIAYSVIDRLKYYHPFNNIINYDKLPFYSMLVVYTNGKSSKTTNLIGCMILSDQIYNLIKRTHISEDRSLMNVCMYGFISTISTSLYFDGASFHPSYTLFLDSVMKPLMHSPMKTKKYFYNIFLVSYKYIMFKCTIRVITYYYKIITNSFKNNNSIYQTQIYENILKILTIDFLRNYIYLICTSFTMYMIRKHKLSPLMNFFCGFIVVGIETSAQAESLIKFTGGQLLYALLRLGGESTKV